MKLSNLHGGTSMKEKKEIEGKRLNVLIPTELHKELKMAATQNDVTLTDLCIQILSEHVKNNK